MLPMLLWLLPLNDAVVSTTSASNAADVVDAVAAL